MGLRMRNDYRLYWLFVLAGLLLLGGCTTTPPVSEPSAPVAGWPVTVQYSRHEIASLLTREYGRWRGTPHRMGGKGRGGFDCSAFSQHLYTALFNLPLPRTTNSQARIGTTINRNQLKPGDLVFFRPHSYPEHVGVYVGNGEFVHASSSQGITRSRLDTDYWRRHYWMARRLVIATDEI